MLQYTKGMIWQLRKTKEIPHNDYTPNKNNAFDCKKARKISVRISGYIERMVNSV